MIINPKIEKQIILNVFNKKKYYFEEILTLTNIAIGSFILFILFLFFKNNDSVNYPYIQDQYSDPKKINDIEEVTLDFENSIQKDKTIPKEEKNEILEYVNKIKKIDEEIYKLISEKNLIIKSLKKEENPEKIHVFLDSISNGIFDEKIFKDLKEHFKSKEEIIKKLKNICNNEKELIRQSKEVFARIVILLKNDNQLFSKMYNQHFGPYSYDNIKNLYNYSIKEDIFYFKILLTPTLKNEEFKINGIFPTTVYNHNLSFKKNNKNNKYQIIYKKNNKQYLKEIDEYNDFLKIIESEKITFDLNIVDISSNKKNNTTELPTPIVTPPHNPTALDNYKEIREDIIKKHNDYKKRYDEFFEKYKQFSVLYEKGSIDESDANKLLKTLNEEKNKKRKEFYHKKIDEIDDKNLRSFESDLSSEDFSLIVDSLTITLLIDDSNQETVLKEKIKEDIKQQIIKNISYVEKEIKDKSIQIDQKESFEKIISNYVIIYDYLKEYISSIEDKHPNFKEYCEKIKAIIDFKIYNYNVIINKPTINYEDILEYLKEDIINIFEEEEDNINELLKLISDDKNNDQNEINEIIKTINQQIEENVLIFEDNIEIKEYNIDNYYDFYTEISNFLSKENYQSLIYENEKTLQNKIDENAESYFLSYSSTTQDDYKKILKDLKNDEKVFKKILEIIEKKNQSNQNSKKDKQKDITNDINNQIEKNISIFIDYIPKKNYKIDNYDNFYSEISSFLSKNEIEDLIYENKQTLKSKLNMNSFAFLEIDDLKPKRKPKNFLKHLQQDEEVFKKILQIIKDAKKQNIKATSKNKLSALEEVIESLEKNQEIKKGLNIQYNKYTLVNNDSDYIITFKVPKNDIGFFEINSKQEIKNKEVADINKIFFENNSYQYFFAKGKYKIELKKLKIIEINLENDEVSEEDDDKTSQIDQILEIKKKIENFKINNDFIDLIKKEIFKYFNLYNKDKNLTLKPTDKILFVTKGKDFHLVFEKGSGISIRYFYFNQNSIADVNQFQILEFNDDYKFNLIKIYKDFFEIKNEKFNFLNIDHPDINNFIEEQKNLEEPLNKDQSNNQNLSYDPEKVGFLKINNNDPNHPEYLTINHRRDYTYLKRNTNIEICFYIKNIYNDNQLLYIKINDDFSDILQSIYSSSSKIMINEKNQYSLNDDQKKEIKKIMNFFKHIITNKHKKPKEIIFNIVKIQSDDSLMKYLISDTNSIIKNKINNNSFILESIENEFIKNYFYKKNKLF